MTVEFTLLQQGDDAILSNVAPDLFDHAINSRLASEFLDDPRHHLAVAIDGGQVVGFASGVHYVHPDKDSELWINEVAVASTHRQRGIGQGVVRKLLEHGRSLGCIEAWVLTDRGNNAAMRLYQSVGGVEAPTPAIMFEFPLK